ncbi:hypothetical protein FCM35_KLT04792 [Carex littledalei]|uniref:Uncharacterized protein n=1 Tax=Carex littledalei TaxID=544730 RepID=A0A833QXK2_9POAL|nr:hypothetical protein FCM35_KLT04792 [Carex littledalei]
MDPEIEVTSAVEAPEFEVTSAAADPEVGGTSAAEAPEIEVTSAAEGPEIEVTSAAEGPEVGGASSEEGPVVQKYWRFDSNTSSDSIFRAPDYIRYGRESDHFEPKLVSIGPYYRERQNLQPMEEKKVRCMSDLLKLRPGDENKGEKESMLYYRGESNMDRVPPVVAVDPFMKFESRARSFYKEKLDQISNDEFVQMLLLDSCFIIRILLSLCGAIAESMGPLEVDIKEVRSDLLLLENQIPLFFLNAVYYWLFPNAHEHMKIRVLLLWFIQRDLPWEYSYNCVLFESDHLLDFYWKSSVPQTDPLLTQRIFEENIKKLREQTTNWANDWANSVPKLIKNATELYKIAGIKFRCDLYSGDPYRDPRGVQLKFSKGIVQMRFLKLDSTMATVLVNLIVFENSKPPFFQMIRTYIKILDDLIDSEKDVEFLQKFEVIFNTLSTHTKAATFFNDIGNLCLINKEFNPTRFYFNNFFENVDKYYKSSWNRRWASLQNNYFNSPWAGISVFAGVILLILTVLATFYTIYAYYNPKGTNN